MVDVASIGIGIGVGVGLILFIIVALVAYNNPERLQNFLSSSPILNIIYYFMPYITTTFVVYFDATVGQVIYTPGIISAVVLFLINGILQKFRGVDLVESPFCGIPGLTAFPGAIPQALLWNATTLSYMAAYNLFMNQSPTFITIAAIKGITLIYQVLQVGRTGVCSDIPYVGGNRIASLVSLSIGLVIGIGVAAIKVFLFPQSTPVSQSSGGLLTGSIGPGSDGTGTCGPPNEKDQFVCETYKNGQLITSTISE